MTEDDMGRAGPLASPRKACLHSTRREALRCDAAHREKVFWTLIAERNSGQKTSVNSDHVVLRELQVQRKGAEPSPVFGFEA